MQQRDTTDEEALLSITVKRRNKKIVYHVHCAKQVKGDELAHYLDEIIEGICTWKPAICEETFQTVAEPLTHKPKGNTPEKNRK
jgi:hypothetical protein